MNSALYILTLFTTLLCAVLLLRAYVQVKKRLLLWSGLCFAGLAVDNFLVFADMVIFPSLDLYSYRLASVAIAVSLLVFGLIWESQ